MMTLNQVGNKTYYIDDLSKVGIYKLECNDVVLIDSGNNKESAIEINDILKENKFNVKYIINTHSHADHTSGNHYFEERNDLTILASKEEKHMIEMGILASSAIYGANPPSFLKNDLLCVESSKVTEISAENTPEGLEIINLPGHTIGMIGVVTSDDVCFLGDALASKYLLMKYTNTIFYIYDVEKYLETLEYLKTLKYKKYILSHGEELNNLKEVIELNKNKINEIKEVILKICSNKKTYEEILKEVFEIFKIKMNITQYYVIGTTVKSFLTYLEDKLEITIEDNKMYYNVK